ncbi:hypothetical protein [Cellulomonas sp. WB94]|uniref:hypothetical protein n=1 Tax=Cellulomonas sp. WB94 TaxID=2173174 RepID=UPI001F5BDE31|nr:hypothetical protein [Cellulomonas sp. WB94]
MLDLLSTVAAAAVPQGLLFPGSVVRSAPFQVLAAFVAINTLVYGTLAAAKALPKVYAPAWFGGRNRRAQNRSIFPDPPERDS